MSNIHKIQQQHRIALERRPSPGGKRRWYHIRIADGLGGQAQSDINKGRCSAVVPAWALLAAIYNEYDFDVAGISVGDSDDTIATTADLVICIPSGDGAELVKAQQDMMNQWLREEYGSGDPRIHCTIQKCERQDTVIDNAAFDTLMTCLEQTPQGVVQTNDKGDVETWNNVGRVSTCQDCILVSTLSYSQDTKKLEALASDIASTFQSNGASTKRL